MHHLAVHEEVGTISRAHIKTRASLPLTLWRRSYRADTASMKSAEDSDVLLTIVAKWWPKMTTGSASAAPNT